MLSAQRIERLRGFLLEQQTNLLHQVDVLAAAVQETNVGFSNHMAEVATDAFDQATAISLRRGHQLTLAQVEDALQRIADGTYGRCERCQEEIDFARLKAVPHTTLCMSCQRLVEL